jgi:hypothetical protein
MGRSSGGPFWAVRWAMRAMLTRKRWQSLTAEKFGQGTIIPRGSTV